jgi:formate dehydrogenase (NADP+) beta subunit
MIELTINGQQILSDEGISILTAAKKAGIYIPSLCFHPNVPSGNIVPEEFIYQGEKKIYHEAGAAAHAECNLCRVMLEGRDESIRACDTPIENGMVIFTETGVLQKERKERLKEILTHHPNICLTCDRVPRCPPFGVCVRSANVPDRCVACPGYAACELIRIADHVGMIGITIPREPVESSPVDDNPFFEFDPKLCVGCGRCVRFCKEVRGIGALGIVVREGRILTGTKAQTFISAGCHFCFGCVAVCPTGALVDKRLKWKEKKGDEERKKETVPCMAACPLQIDVPQYLHHITRKAYDDALSVIEEKVPFASLCGAICTHPCEAACRRGEMDQPVAIKDLKRFVAENARKVEETAPLSSSGKRVAIVGSGPAGLTAAYMLRKKAGHDVTVFESCTAPGGMPLTGIPRFRLPQSVLNLEIERVRQSGVQIVTSTTVESVESLLSRGFDAVLMAIGAHAEIPMGIEGEENPSVMGAIDLLRKVNLGADVTLGESVAIIGGGNVALDAARVSKRIGAGEVTVIYRRSINEMPADPKEIEEAALEGVRFMYLASPIRYEAQGEKICVGCIKYELKRPDASGRRRPKPIQGSEFSFLVDTVITAIGQYTKIPDELHADADERGRIKVRGDRFITSRESVFAAGDAVSGPGTVTEAIAMGAKAANAINIYLGGNELIDLAFFNPSKLPPKLDPGDQFLLKRVSMPLRPVEDRVKNFEPVELGFTEEMAVREANRCLRCSLRLDVDSNL